MYNIMASHFVTNPIDLLKPSVKNPLCWFLLVCDGDDLWRART